MVGTFSRSPACIVGNLAPLPSAENTVLLTNTPAVMTRAIATTTCATNSILPLRLALIFVLLVLLYLLFAVVIARGSVQNGPGNRKRGIRTRSFVFKGFCYFDCTEQVILGQS